MTRCVLVPHIGPTVVLTLHAASAVLVFCVNTLRDCSSGASLYVVVGREIVLYPNMLAFSHLLLSVASINVINGPE